MPIKVTHVVRQYAPSIGGMEDVVKNIAIQQIKQHGHIPTIVTLDRVFTKPCEILPSVEIMDGIRIIRIPYSGSSRYPIAPNVLSHLTDAHVVHVHGVDFFYDYLALTKLSHRRPLIASTHGGFFHTEFASTLKKVYFQTVTRAASLAYDRVVGTSINDGEMFKTVVKASKLSVIENGVNIEKYSCKASAQLRPVAIYFGRWSSNKGLTETVETFRQLVNINPSWKLIIAGREYDFSSNDLNEMVKEYQLTANIRIVANPSEQELADLIGDASYYICLSRHEGFGIAPIEAMSAGLIPILSDIPPFRNLIEKSGIGVLLDVSQIEPSVRKIKELYEQGDVNYIRHRTIAKDFVERYSWCNIVGQYVDLYNNLAKKNEINV
jgi:alpha-1,3-mannosyltransferase